MNAASITYITAANFPTLIDHYILRNVYRVSIQERILSKDTIQGFRLSQELRTQTGRLHNVSYLMNE